MAAIYWEVNDPVNGFEVRSRALTFQVRIVVQTLKYFLVVKYFQVLLYTITAFLGLFLIVARRKLSIFGCAELGGPTGSKYFSAGFLFFLWLVFIVFNSLRAYGVIESPLP